MARSRKTSVDDPVGVAGLSREQAADLVRWSALALLRAALAEGDRPKARP